MRNRVIRYCRRHGMYLCGASSPSAFGWAAFAYLPSSTLLRVRTAKRLIIVIENRVGQKEQTIGRRVELEQKVHRTGS